MNDVVDTQIDATKGYINVPMFPLIIRYALISILVSAVYSMLLYVAEKHFSMQFGLLSLLIPCVIVFFAIAAFRKANGGWLSFGKGFLFGILFFLLCGILGWAWQYLYTNFIIPNYWEGLADSMETMFENFGMSDDQIEESIGKMLKNKTNQLIQLANALGTIMVLGIIFSLIAAAVMKKEKETKLI